MIILQVFINGLLLGCLYGIVALGFSLVWGVMNIINIVHGAAIMLGSYVSFWLFTSYGIDPLLSLPLITALLFIYGFFLQKYVINLIVRAPLFMTFILTYAINLVIVNLALFLWTADFKSVRPSYGNLSLNIGELAIPYTRLASSMIAIILIAGLVLFMSKTKTGRAIKAVRMDLGAAQLMGVNVSMIYAITFGLSSALAGAAGSLISINYSISPFMGADFLFKAFIVCIVGGLGNMTGALFGGLFFGFIETFGSFVFEPTYQYIINFLLMVFVLIIRPMGLVGKEYY